MKFLLVWFFGLHLLNSIFNAKPLEMELRFDKSTDGFDGAHAYKHLIFNQCEFVYMCFLERE